MSTAKAAKAAAAAVGGSGSSGVGAGGVQRTARQLYRDCLRLVQHVAPGRTSSAKSIALRESVRTQFRKHQHERDPLVIEHCKANAVRALSNYLVAAAAPKDPKVKAAMKDYHDRSVQSARSLRHDITTTATATATTSTSTIVSSTTTITTTNNNDNTK